MSRREEMIKSSDDVEEYDDVPGWDYDDLDEDEEAYMDEMEWTEGMGNHYDMD